MGSGSAHADNTIYVTTAQQEINGNDECSLQEAIYSANFDDNIATVATNPDQFVETACVAGNGHDTIVLPSGAVLPMAYVVDDAHNPFGPTATPIVTSAITIEANGARLEHVPNGVNFRAFAVWGEPGDVFGPGNLTIRNAWIRGFTTKGGNGADGGGGGLGAGGAIYVRLSWLTVENSTFEGNGAAGGDGSHNYFELMGGGGGGLGGNGGLSGTSALGGGGGGGGARGDGGDGDVYVALGGAGGGGGGTVTDGESGDDDAETSAGELDGGFACGGTGGWTDIGFGGDDGDGGCFGGGGGGGESYRPTVGVLAFGNGGAGGYGGGGGGAGYDLADGGEGGFGGGGGSGTTEESSLDGLGPDGGDGGYGGGGGAGHGGFISGAPGDGGGEFRGGHLGGNASEDNGGGGAALGGAIFSHGGAVTIANSTFTGNFVVRGLAGGPGAAPGRDAGGAVFSLGGSLTVLNATLSGNESTGEGAGIVVHLPTDGIILGGGVAHFTLRNTIIANSVPNIRTCFFDGSVDAQGSGNLIQSNFGCPGMAQTEDPQLGPLQLYAPGNTPTMEIQPTSVAADTADAATSLLTDQRGVTRPTNAGFDIGAFEARQSVADLALTKEALPATALPGDTIIFRLGVGNLGPDDASSVVVADNLPSAVTFVSCSATAGTCGGSGNDRTISYATFAALTNHVIDLTTTLDFDVPDGTVITNTASVSAESPADPNAANDAASASVTVHNKADLLLTQSVKKLTSRRLRYTVVMKNLGPYEARRIELNDPMPNGTKFVSGSPGSWSCEPLPDGSVGTLSCSLASLDFNASATLVFTVKTTAPGSVNISNTATVSAGTFDPNLANNSATLVTRVSGK